MKASYTFLAKIVGGLLRQIRGAMTQADFAKALRLSLPQYNRYETGKRIPPDEIMERIAKRNPDFYERMRFLLLDHYVGLAHPDFHMELEQKSGREYLEAICLFLLVSLASEQAGIRLTPHGYERVMAILQDEAWPQTKRLIADLVKVFIDAMPSWQEDVQGSRRDQEADEGQQGRVKKTE